MPVSPIFVSQKIMTFILSICRLMGGIKRFTINQLTQYIGLYVPVQIITLQAYRK